MRNKQDLKATNIEQFHLMAVPNAMTEDGKIKLNIHVMIPSYALQFVKENGGFESSFEARISLLNKEGKQIKHEAIQETLKASDYLETVSKSNWYFIEQDFLVEPGKYTIVSEVMDIDTRNRGIREKEIDLTKYVDDFILFPPQVMIHYKGTWQGGKKLMPSYKNEISVQQPTVPVLISGKVQKGEYSLNLEIKDADDVLINKLDSTFTNSIENFSHQLELNLNEVQGLRVKLYVNLLQNDKSDQQLVELKIKRPGVSSNIREVDEAIDQMRYILSNEERSKLNKVRKNRLNARAKYTKAASMLRFLLTVFDFLRMSSSKLARYAIDVKTQSALRINNTPSENICRVTLSLSVFTNCGKKTKTTVTRYR